MAAPKRNHGAVLAWTEYLFQYTPAVWSRVNLGAQESDAVFFRLVDGIDQHRIGKKDVHLRAGPLVARTKGRILGATRLECGQSVCGGS
jgi:hypothetical protein